MFWLKKGSLFSRLNIFKSENDDLKETPAKEPKQLPKKLSANFSLAEGIKSQTAIRGGIDNTPSFEEAENMKLVAQRILQPCRDHFGVPFTPSSFFRCKELNKRVDGSPTSQHMTGQAVDFEVPGVSNMELALWIARNLDFDQVILEFYTPGEPDSGWVHCSYNINRNRKEALMYTNRKWTSLDL